MSEINLTSSVRYALPVFKAGDAGGHNPADATTYYFGLYDVFDPVTADTNGLNLSIWEAGTLIGATIEINVQGTLGTTEQATVVVRLNSTSSTTLSSAVQFDQTTQSYVVTGLSLALAANDRIKIGVTTPTWATNPTVVLYRVQLIFRPTGL